MKQPNEIKTIEDLEEEFSNVFEIKDTGFVRIVVASVIGNRLDMDPVWLMLIAPSSGGKTEIINSLNGLDFIYPISDITVNTFASGMKVTGVQTSLLLKMNNGIMAFKDFTSILSKSREAKSEILKQLREIYDGEYNKHTGTGTTISWKGKLGAIGGATEIIYRHLEEFAAMGDRYIMYSIDQPDRKAASKRARENTHKIIEYREHLKECCKYYINSVIEYMENNEIDEINLPKEVEDELYNVTDFATRARSAVLTDFKSGQVDLVPSIEMPMRVVNQLNTIASAFILMDKAAPAIYKKDTGTISNRDKNILYKIALDSIPRTRRDVLKLLAEYREGVTTAGVGTELNLPTASVGKYLAQINALGICKRIKNKGPHGDKWIMSDEEYRGIMCSMNNITPKNILLESAEVEDDAEISWEAENERREAENSSFDAF